jgi:hypothetical protein
MAESIRAEAGVSTVIVADGSAFVYMLLVDHAAEGESCDGYSHDRRSDAGSRFPPNCETHSEASGN